MSVLLSNPTVALMARAIDQQLSGDLPDGSVAPAKPGDDQANDEVDLMAEAVLPDDIQLDSAGVHAARVWRVLTRRQRRRCWKMWTTTPATCF